MGVIVPRYVVDDLERFPDDGNRYELLDGVLLVTPSPALGHQAIAARLVIALGSAQVQGRATIFAPGAVSFPPSTQLEPDVLVTPFQSRLDVKWHEVREHWLAVEIISPSSRIYDRDFKRDAYLALGVREVWLVDPAARTVEVSRAGMETSTRSDVLAWTVPHTDERIDLSLAELFEGA